MLAGPDVFLTGTSFIFSNCHIIDNSWTLNILNNNYRHQVFSCIWSCLIFFDALKTRLRRNYDRSVWRWPLPNLSCQRTSLCFFSLSCTLAVTNLFADELHDESPYACQWKNEWTFFQISKAPYILAVFGEHFVDMHTNKLCPRSN